MNPIQQTKTKQTKTKKMVWFKVNILQPSSSSSMISSNSKLYLFRDHFELLTNDDHQSSIVYGQCKWMEIAGIQVDTDRTIITVNNQSGTDDHHQYRFQFSAEFEMRQFLDFVCLIHQQMICHYHSNKPNILRYAIACAK